MRALGVRSRIEKYAQLLAALRRFFDERGFIEVQTPLLSDEVIPERHIEPLQVSGSRHWLQASPEAHMKRLLVALSAEAPCKPAAIYQITKSFRAGEIGQLHRPEFTMAEWYRCGDGLEEGMLLMEELCCALAPCDSVQRITYQQAFERFAGFNPHAVSVKELAERAAQCGAVLPDANGTEDQRDELLNVLLAKLVEPELGRQGPALLFEYPASQASLAAVSARADGLPVAERFELYWHGIELANGFHELGDAHELRERFQRVIDLKKSEGRGPPPMPEKFLAAMETGLPPCAGVALGFDRLLTVLEKAAQLDGVLPDY